MMVKQFWTYYWEKNSTLPKLKLYLSYHPFIKYDIFEVTVNFPSRGQYCENHNMPYIYQSKKIAFRNLLPIQERGPMYGYS